MSETLQLLFDSFLEANEIDFRKKGDIYEINFEKPYAAIFGEKLKCTFEEEKKKNGTFQNEN